MIKKWILRLAIVIARRVRGYPVHPNRVSNPSTRDEPAWDSPRTRALAVAACYDCHSNQTKVMWFEKVAPLSWWIKGHVDDGRGALNFSEWKTKHGEPDSTSRFTRSSAVTMVPPIS